MPILANQVALVTGASSGIGQAIAIACGAAGAKTVVNYPFDSQRQAADDTVAQIEAAGGVALALQADVSREAEVAAMFARTAATWGRLDVLISNAGIQSDSPFVAMTLEQWNKVLAVNLTGAFLCAQEAAKLFLRQGIDASRSAAAGKIIFTSSVHQEIPWAGHANYAASKGGLMMLMKTIAQELAPQRIRVNSIAPGAIKTPINEQAWRDPQAEAELEKLIPYGRVGQTGDVAPLALWLASDESDYITGATIFVDGGMMLYPGFRTGG